jgi:hypothetical protein
VNACCDVRGVLIADTGSFLTNLAVCIRLFEKSSVYCTVIKFVIALNLELKLRPRRQVCLVVFSKSVYYEFKKRDWEYSQQT